MASVNLEEDKEPKALFFDVDKFLGEWQELYRYTAPEKPDFYPANSYDTRATYTLISRRPLQFRVYNSTRRAGGLIPCLTHSTIKGLATRKQGSMTGRVFNVDFSILPECCECFLWIMIRGGIYEVLDFEEENGRYTHLFVGSGNDDYRWILVRDRNKVNSLVVDRFKSMFPQGVLIRSKVTPDF